MTSPRPLVVLIYDRAHDSSVIDVLMPPDPCPHLGNLWRQFQALYPEPPEVPYYEEDGGPGEQAWDQYTATLMAAFDGAGEQDRAFVRWLQREHGFTQANYRWFKCEVLD